MKKIIILITILFYFIPLKAQNKKEQIQTLNSSLDSLKQVVLQERTANYLESEAKNTQILSLNDQLQKVNQRKDSLLFEVNKTQEEKDLLNQEVAKLNREIEALKKQVEEKHLLNQEVAKSNREIEALKKQLLEKQGGNSTNPFRNSSNFEHFLSYFISNVYSNTNIDSLVYVSSPVISDLTNSNTDFGRFYNLGAYCNLYNKSSNFGYHGFGSEYFGDKEPDIANLPFFKDKYPDDGYCEEASTPNGVYFSKVDDLPEDVDMETGDYIPAPSKLKNLKKMKVEILNDKWVTTTLYFIQSNNKWFLLYIDDCDCSA
jgi:hypothetical protein